MWGLAQGGGASGGLEAYMAAMAAMFDSINGRSAAPGGAAADDNGTNGSRGSNGGTVTL